MIERDGSFAHTSMMFAEIERLHGTAADLIVANDRLRASNAELSSALAVMWHAYDTDNRPPHGVLKLARKCFEEGRAAIAKAKGEV